MPTVIPQHADTPPHFHTDEPLVQIGWQGQTGRIYALTEDVAATERGSFSPIYRHWGETCGHHLRLHVDGACGDVAPTMRTPERRDADAALESALDQIAEAYDLDGLRVGWLLAFNFTKYDGDHPASVITWHSPEGQSWVANIGILEATRLRLHASYLEPDE